MPSRRPSCAALQMVRRLSRTASRSSPLRECPSATGRTQRWRRPTPRRVRCTWRRGARRPTPLGSCCSCSDARCSCRCAQPVPCSGVVCRIRHCRLSDGTSFTCAGVRSAVPVRDAVRPAKETDNGVASAPGQRQAPAVLSGGRGRWRRGGQRCVRREHEQRRAFLLLASISDPRRRAVWYHFLPFVYCWPGGQHQMMKYLLSHVRRRRGGSRKARCARSRRRARCPLRRRLLLLPGGSSGDRSIRLRFSSSYYRRSPSTALLLFRVLLLLPPRWSGADAAATTAVFVVLATKHGGGAAASHHAVCVSGTAPLVMT